MANTIVVDIVADTRKLVAGVNTTNQRLSTLNGTATKISNGFGLITKALAVIGTAKVAWQWIKDLEEEQNNFDRIADNFGKSADKIIDKIGDLSIKFKIDDGDIAASLNQLANSTTFRYKKLLPQITELVLLADNLSGGAGENIDKYTSVWSKALRSGKVLGGDDLTKLGIASKLTEAEQKKFQSLKTITEQIQFLYQSLEEELQPDALKFTAAQELTYEVGKMKEAIAELLKEEVLPAVLKALQILKTLLFFEDKDGNLKLREEVVLLAQALALLWTNGKLSALITALTSAEGLLTRLGKPFAGIRAAFAGLGLADITAAFSLLAGAIANAWKALSPFKKIAIVLSAGYVALKLLPEKYEAVAKEILDALIYPFNHPIEAIKSWKDWPKNFFQGMKDMMWNWFKSIFRVASPSKVMMEWGMMLIEGLLNAFNINNLITTLKTFFTNLYNRISTEIRAQNWKSIGNNIINALVSGMQAIASSPVNFITKLAQNMINTFKSFFKISSPSKVFAGFGQNMMQGLAVGIRGNSRLPQMALNGLSLTPATAGGMGRSITVNINAGIGTDPYEVGRYVQAALDKYAGVNGR